MKRQITFTVKHQEDFYKGWVKVYKTDRITRISRLEEFLGNGSIPKTDYKVRYSPKVDGELEVYSTGSVIKEGRPMGGVLCFLYDIPEWTGKRIHREVILGGKKR